MSFPVKLYYFRLAGSAVVIYFLSACLSSPRTLIQAEYIYPSAFSADSGGKKIVLESDIRSPQEVLSLLSGTLTSNKGSIIELWFTEKERFIQEQIWSNIIVVLRQYGIRYFLLPNHQRIQTGWVSWRLRDEPSSVLARYEFSKFAGVEYGIRVKLLDIRSFEKEKSSLKNALLTERYKVEVLNKIIFTSHYYQSCQ